LCQYDNVGRREQNEYLNKKRLPIAQLIKNKGISDGKKKLKKPLVLCKKIKQTGQRKKKNS